MPQNDIFQICIPSHVGGLRLVQEKDSLVRIDFLGQAWESTKPEHINTGDSTPLLENCRQELQAYFKKDLREFSIPLRPQGSPFQEKVWNILRSIPYGETWTYKQVAIQAGCPLGARAVGQANHYNPIPILIPCHRVVQSGGKLGGYAGGLDVKTFLLELESSHRPGNPARC